jgi:hypothetical protein
MGDIVDEAVGRVASGQARELQTPAAAMTAIEADA